MDLAFDFIVGRSYDWMIDRLNMAESRIHTLQTLATTIMVGVPVLAAAAKDRIDITSPVLLIAGGAYLVVFVCSTFLVTRGWLTLISPSALYEEWLHKSPWEFKKDLIFFAADHDRANEQLLNERVLIFRLMAIALLVQTAFLLAWLEKML